MRPYLQPVFFAVVIVCLLSWMSAGRGGVGAAVASSPGTIAPAPATIASCDTYRLVELLLDQETFAKPRKAREDAIKAELAPTEAELNHMQAELASLREQLQRANPQDAAAKVVFGDFESKRKTFEEKVQTYNTVKEQRNQEYSALVSGQFVAAYEQVGAEAGRVGAELGYTHVVTQKSGKIMAADPRRLIEEFLSRPLAAQPTGSDITEQVRTAMKLPEKTAAEASDKPESAPATESK